MGRNTFLVSHAMREYKINDPNIASSLIIKQASDYINIWRKMFGKLDQQVSNLFYDTLQIFLLCSVQLFEVLLHLLL